MPSNSAVSSGTRPWVVIDVDVTTIDAVIEELLAAYHGGGADRSFEVFNEKPLECPSNSLYLSPPAAVLLETWPGEAPPTHFHTGEVPEGSSLLIGLQP